GTSARDIEAYMDWLDIQFDRKDIPWENELFYNYSFEKWKALSGEHIDINDFPEILAGKPMLTDNTGEKIQTVSKWKEKKANIKKEIRWILGEKPAGVPGLPIRHLDSEEDYISSFINRPQVDNGVKKTIAPYRAVGDYL